MLLTDDQQALHDVASRFARERLRPGYQQREHEGGIDRALCREMGGLGLLGIDLPEAFGGMGQSGVTAGLIVEDDRLRRLQRQLRAAARHSLMGMIVARNAPAELAPRLGAEADRRRGDLRARPDRAARRLGRRAT